MAPTLTTTRLTLRPYAAGDRARFVGWFTDPQLMAHLDGAMTDEQAERLFDELAGLAPRRARIHTAWAVCRDGAHCGHAVLLNETEGTEIGYLVAADHQGQGLATEIAHALVGYGHGTLGLPRLVATVDDGNHASRRVLEKAGMAPVRREEDEDGAWWLYAREA